MNLILLVACNSSSCRTYLSVAQHKQPRTCFIVSVRRKKEQKISPQNELLYIFEIISLVSAFLVLRLYFLCCYTNWLSLLNIFSNETDVFFVFVFKSSKIYKCICLLRKKDKFLLDQRLKKYFVEKPSENILAKTEINWIKQGKIL